MTEEQAIIKVTPYLQELCKGRWMNLEYEDRVAETQYAFLSSLRYYSVNSGHFMEDFLSATQIYMDDLNRKTPSLYFGFSLDADMAAKNRAEHCNAHCFLTARDDTESRMYVNFFVSSLPKIERNIVNALMSGDSRKEIAKEYDMTLPQLKYLLDQIGNRYLNEYGRD